MADIVTTAFALKRSPFNASVTDDELWLDDANTMAVDRLVTAVSRKGHALVKAESGAGKTSLLRAMRSELSPAHFRIVYTAMVTLGPRDFLRQVCRALGVESKATAAAAFNAIQAQVCQMHGDHRIHPVLVIDEVHLIPERTLQHLHILTNFDFDSQPLLSLVLVGLPEFHERLRMSIHRSLLTRVSVAVELRPTDPDRTASYVRHRLAGAGAKAELFTPDALTMLHELSGGLLRSVDVIASGALTVAARTDQRLVDRHMVTAAYRQTPLA
jgi:general secretion pathway protein A